jgi:hypothetical protein
MCAALAFIAIGLIIIHYYKRGIVGLIFATIIAFRMRRQAAVKVWVITIILFIVAIAAEDLSLIEQPRNNTATNLLTISSKFAFEG